jgi:hypothetical protein
MAGSLNAGFSNNINIMQIRTSGSSSQRVTDRAVDIDSDGNDETVTVTGGTSAGGNKVNPPASISRETGSLLDGTNAGVARSVLGRTTEVDRGVNTSGSEFTEGVA